MNRKPLKKNSGGGDDCGRAARAALWSIVGGDPMATGHGLVRLLHQCGGRRERTTAGGDWKYASPLSHKQKAAGLTHFITQHISYFYAQATSAFVFIFKSLRIQECQRLLARNIRKGFFFLFIPPLPAALPLAALSLV